MLDCCGVNALRLRFPNRDQAELVLGPGVHSIGRDASGEPRVVDSVAEAAVLFCVDRRGIWLQLREGARLHVNGRPVRRMAMLRPGDCVYFEGSELLLLGPDPLPAPADAVPVPANGNVLLRGVGGQHHGRAFPLDQPRIVGRLPDSDICISDPDFADRHARLEPHPDGVVLRDMGSHAGSVVNGHPVRHALLRPGDQVAFDAHRFVVEAPLRSGAQALVVDGPDMPHEPLSELATDGRHAAMVSSARRIPWLLLAALFLAGALSLLLLYGAR